MTENKPQPLTDALAELIRLTHTQNALLSAMADSMNQLRQAYQPVEPDYRRPLAAYATFDWRTIDATVTESDQDGPAIIEWNRHTWKRRSGDGKYGRAIWYSRPAPTDTDENNYYRLITFKDYDQAEPIKPSIPTTPATAGIATTGDPAHDQHLTYQDGTIATQPAEIASFNDYLSHNRKPPTNINELRNWHQRRKP